MIKPHTASHEATQVRSNREKQASNTLASRSRNTYSIAQEICPHFGHNLAPAKAFGRSRTGNLLITNQLHCQLCYEGQQLF